MISTTTAGTRVRTHEGLVGTLTGDTWFSAVGHCVKIKLDRTDVTASGTVNCSIEFVTKIALTAAQEAEAEMIHTIYDMASTNDGACRVAEVARGLCTQHEAADKDFDREGYLAIVLRTLRAARGY